ncbi:uncharacterized protein LOC130455954 [Monodelphis domestica]|uniref:uncharacterized protein LOC130455954 n=1 Tax=Monodelphis domestica TaxID=13616 RepID=UPI0000F2E1A9|nr:uncharacterized protein LOC130455954 [Monodelphis domestica]
MPHSTHTHTPRPRARPRGSSVAGEAGGGAPRAGQRSPASAPPQIIRKNNEAAERASLTHLVPAPQPANSDSLCSASAPRLPPRRAGQRPGSIQPHPLPRPLAPGAGPAAALPRRSEALLLLPPSQSPGPPSVPTAPRPWRLTLPPLSGTGKPMSVKSRTVRDSHLPAALLHIQEQPPPIGPPTVAREGMSLSNSGREE